VELSEVGRNLKPRFVGLLALALSVSALALPNAAATDFLVGIDKIVVSIHDYSVLTGKVNNKLTIVEAKSLTSKLNNKLSLIRTNIVNFDKDLSYNWKILIDSDNVNYPHRQLLKDFDIQVFDWFNNELKIEENANKCLAQKTGQIQCLVQLRNKVRNSELKKYKALTETLSVIQAWRQRYGR
jgi:hypothetical protein